MVARKELCNELISTAVSNLLSTLDDVKSVGLGPLKLQPPPPSLFLTLGQSYVQEQIHQIRSHPVGFGSCSCFSEILVEWQAVKISSDSTLTGSRSIRQPEETAVENFDLTNPLRIDDEQKTYPKGCFHRCCLRGLERGNLEDRLHDV